MDLMRAILSCRPRKMRGTGSKNSALTYNVKHYPMPEVKLYGFDTPAAT